MTFGINFFGPINTEDGIGEAARAALAIFKTLGVPLAINVVERSTAKQLEIYSENKFYETPYSINYFHFSSRWVPYYIEKIGSEHLNNKYNIGYWVCEVPRYPDDWAKNHVFFHEIWTASSFCQVSISNMIPKPTILVPHPIINYTPAKKIELPKIKNKFTFLAMANMHSDIERKNILGVLKSFSQAFKSQVDVCLIIKLSNSQIDKEYYQKIINLQNKDKRIIIIDEFLTREEVVDLYYISNAYISLHRAEGFGLTIAESMSYGIPTIITAYSGNMDFCDFSNSFLVEYDLVNIGENRLRYKSTDVWAEPRINSAIEQLKLVYNDRILVKRKIKNAKASINKLSLENIAQIVQNRLKLIKDNFNYKEDC